MPVVGNIMAFVDMLSDLANLLEKAYQEGEVAFLDWTNYAIDLIGVVPLPADTAPGRMILRPMLYLVRQKLDSGTPQLGEAVLKLLANHLNSMLAGDITTYVSLRQAKLGELLDTCAALSDQIFAALASALERCLADKALFDKPATVALETRLHDPEHISAFDRMLAALADFSRLPADRARPAPAEALSKPAQETLRRLLGHIQTLKASFRTQLKDLADPGKEQSIGWLLQTLHAALALRRKEVISVMVPADKGVRVHREIYGMPIETVGLEAPVHQAASPCKLGAIGATRTSTGGAIDFATGEESITHTDFVIPAPLPIAWQRTYRSSLDAFDRGLLGARWRTPYTSRLDVRGTAKQPTLVYHAADGRSHTYPWLEVGEICRDSVEEITLRRITQQLLLIDFGKPLPDTSDLLPAWRETYELVETCPGKIGQQGKRHFRLGALQNAHGATIGLRYDFPLTKGPHAGEKVLSDILSKQGETLLAHVRVQPDPVTGRAVTLWELRPGQLDRQLAIYTYDATGDLIQAQDENAASWHYTYHQHLLTRYTDRTGRGTNIEYDLEGEPNAAERSHRSGRGRWQRRQHQHQQQQHRHRHRAPVPSSAIAIAIGWAPAPAPAPTAPHRQHQRRHRHRHRHRH